MYKLFFLHFVADSIEIKKRFTELGTRIDLLYIFEFLTFAVKYDFLCALI